MNSLLRTRGLRVTTKYLSVAGWLTLITVCLSFGAQVAEGQSPAIGPRSYGNGATGISVGAIKGFVKTQVQQALVNANTAIHVEHPNISVSLVGDVTFNSPYRIATESTDKPNQFYVKLPMHFKVNVDIPVVADRQLYYPLDLNFTCDKWYAGGGPVKIATVVGPPDIQGGSVVENLFMVRDLIDAKVKASLPQIGSMSQTLGAARCVDIGAALAPGSPGVNDSIMWDEPGHRVIVAGAIAPRLTVTYLRLKRLQARGNGGLLYYPTENIMLDVYSNFTESQKSLTMNEGDDVALNMPPVNFSPPYSDTLVVIANIQQQNNSYTEDSAFGSAVQSARFSPGTHKITITKSYVIPGGPGHPKPSFGHAAAYELTYQVEYVTPPNVMSSPRATVRGTR